MSVSTVTVRKHLPTELTRVGFQFHVNSSVMNLKVSVGTTSAKYSPANHAGHAVDGINITVLLLSLSAVRKSVFRNCIVS